MLNGPPVTKFVIRTKQTKLHNLHISLNLTSVALVYLQPEYTSTQDAHCAQENWAWMRVPNPFVATGCYRNTDSLLQQLQAPRYKPMPMLCPQVSSWSLPGGGRCSEPLPTANMQGSDASCRGKDSKVSTADKVCVLKGEIRFPDI